MLKAVLEQVKTIKQAMSAYIDDIYVNEDVAPVEAMKKHLKKYGWTSKDLKLQNSARSLGRAKSIAMAAKKRCGKLAGDFSVSEWLQVATGFIKHQATAIKQNWDDEIGDAPLECIKTDTLTWVWQLDPAQGRWSVNMKELNVWVNKSSLAVGVVLDADGAIIEDTC